MPSIFLIGFMAAGKSQVARSLANQLKMPYVDLDTLIEEETGQTVAQLFSSEGESGFREHEVAALKSTFGAADMVIATGGGTPCYEDNLQQMRDAGLVVHLAAGLKTTRQRAAQSSQDRPLLDQDESAIARLYRERAPVYRRAHLSVCTEEKSVDEVATAIGQAMLSVQALPFLLQRKAAVVALGTRSYPVIVEQGSLQLVGTVFRASLPTVKRVAIVSDETVMPLYGKTVRGSLEAAGLAVVEATVAPGESSKEIGVFSALCETLIAGGLDRSSAIVALGGGVVGDLAGYVAASLFRGIPVVQLPTTLLAMTDSAIGGKTGINTSQGKNLVGAFWQPAFVLADPDTLQTLSVRERRAAFGELVKYALLDGALWPLVERLAPQLCATELQSTAELASLVRACATLKAGIVSADERESGLRGVLNLGHTVGHAIEVHAGYGQVLHGEAVALGLLATCRVSQRLGLCAEHVESDVARVLASAGLETDLAPWLIPEVLDRMGVDKKRTGSKVRFIAVHKLGDVRQRDIELTELTGLLLAD